MKSAHRKLLMLSLLTLLILLPGVLAWKAYRQVQLGRALITAVKHNDTSMAISLLAEGADANARDVPADFHWRWQQFWDRLRGKKSAVEVPSSALFLAIQDPSETDDVHENIPLIQALLDKGADINARNAGGNTALIRAVQEYHLAAIRLLIERGANVNLKNDVSDHTGIGSGGAYTWQEDGDAAVQYAHDIPTLQLLFEHGADVNARDYYGNTLLMNAATSMNIDRPRFLLAHGAEVNAVDNTGCTALMDAALRGTEEMIALLQQHGADVNVRDHEGKTALMYCMEAGQDNHKMLQQLLQMGADPCVKTAIGKTAWSIAQSWDERQSMSILQKAEDAITKRSP